MSCRVNVTSYTKTYTNGYLFELLKTVCLPFIIHLRSEGSCSNGWGYPFRKVSSHSNSWCYPFRKNICPFERLRVSVPKKNAAVWKADVVRLEKIFSCSNGRCRFCSQKNLSARLNGQRYLMRFSFPNGLDYPFRMNFIQLSEWLLLFKTNIQSFRFQQLRLSILKEKLYCNLKSCAMSPQNSCSNSDRCLQ